MDDSGADLRSRVVSVEHQVQSNVSRLATLEAWRVQRDIEGARHDERWKAMDSKIDHVGTKVDKIAGDLSRIMWLVLSGIILGVVAFLIKGGFAA